MAKTVVLWCFKFTHTLSQKTHTILTYHPFPPTTPVTGSGKLHPIKNFPSFRSPHQDHFRETWTRMNQIFPCLPTFNYKRVGHVMISPELLIFAFYFKRGPYLAIFILWTGMEEKILLSNSLPIRYSLLECYTKGIWQSYLSKNWIQALIPHAVRGYWLSWSLQWRGLQEPDSKSLELFGCMRTGVCGLRYNKISPGQ